MTPSPTLPPEGGRETSPTVKPKAAVVVVDDESRPPSERIQGKWKMDIATVPDGALTKEFIEWKRQGKAKQLRVEYTITASEFTVDKWGPGGRMHKRFHYEILKEIDNSLMLKRFDEAGVPQEIPAVLRDGKLIIGTGGGKVPLERIE